MPFIETEASVRYEVIDGKRVPIITPKTEVTLTNTVNSEMYDLANLDFYNFNVFSKNMCINSSYNGISFLVDMIEDNPEKARIFSLRSFGESLYHSITDASLEYGYKCI